MDQNGDKRQRDFFLASLFDDANSEGDSDSESIGSAHSGCSGGVSLVCDLPVCSRDPYGICGDPTARHGNNWDGSAHRRVGNTRGPSAISMIGTVENCAVRILRSRAAETPPNRPRSETASPNPSERKGEVFLENHLIKNDTNAPYEQQTGRF